MSNQNNFAGGFLAGAIFGGIVGGVIGAVIGSSRTTEALPADELEETGKKPVLRSSERSIEAARRGLEDKIAQLNDAIDDVRQQLSSVNGSIRDEEAEQSLGQDS